MFGMFDADIIQANCVGAAHKFYIRLIEVISDSEYHRHSMVNIQVLEIFLYFL